MNYFVLMIIFLILAGISKALMDHSSEGRFTKPWFNKSSWLNKWKLDGDGALIPYSGKPQVKYLWAFTPQYVERFYLSSSLQSFRTDGWHFFQLFFLLFLSLGVAAAAASAGRSFLLAFVIARLCIGVSFTLTRRFALNNPN